MKQTRTKKLSLSKTTLRQLGARQLGRVGAALDETTANTQTGTGWETGKCGTNQQVSYYCITWDPLRTLLCTWLF